MSGRRASSGAGTDGHSPEEERASAAQHGAGTHSRAWCHRETQQRGKNTCNLGLERIFIPTLIGKCISCLLPSTMHQLSYVPFKAAYAFSNDVIRLGATAQVKRRKKKREKEKESNECYSLVLCSQTKAKPRAVLSRLRVLWSRLLVAQRWRWLTCPGADFGNCLRPRASHRVMLCP